MSGGERSNNIADNIVFGCTKISDAPDDHVEDLWANSGDDEYSAVKKEVLESQSKRTLAELSYPDFMKNPEYRHGVTASMSVRAEQLIYANCDSTDCANDKENKPGQQHKRHYRWPVNPETTTFGIKGESGTSGVAEALHMKDDSEEYDCVSQKRHDPDKIFGKSTSSPNSSAADCLGHTVGNEGNTSSARDEADDLGTSLTPGFRNASTRRIFGCPSIRTDISKYERASVADTQNYGDDVNAGYLLRPSLFSSFGLEEDEFLKPRTRDYLHNFFHRCGFRVEDDLFDEIFQKVSDGNHHASIDAFRFKLEDLQPR